MARNNGAPANSASWNQAQWDDASSFINSSNLNTEAGRSSVYKRAQNLGFGADETASILNRTTGGNYTAAGINDYGKTNNFGTLERNNGTNNLASKLAAGYNNGGDFQSAYDYAKSNGQDASSVAQIINAQIGAGQTDAAGVDAWTRSKGLQDLRLGAGAMQGGQAQPASNQGGSNNYTTEGSSSRNEYQQNPYMSRMADDIQRRSGQALGQGLQDIRGNAVGVGGLGGSRQGVAEGLAIAGANDNLTGNLANMFGTDYTNSQNRNLQRYGVDTNARLTNSAQELQRYGINTNATMADNALNAQRYSVNTNAALTNQGQMQNFYTANRGQDLQQLGLGAQLYGQGNAGFLSQGQGVNGLGNTQQQAPWNVANNANAAITPYTGYGSSSTSTASNQQGGGFSGAAGGALGGYQIGKNLGFGSFGGSSNGMAMTNGGGFTNMPNYMIQG